MNYKIVNGGVELVDLIKPLWEELNHYHLEQSVHFKEKFETMSFEARKNKLLSNRHPHTNIDLVYEKVTDDLIGYCVSTVNSEKVGEIDSLYVKPHCRKFGFGDLLMDNALSWLETKNVTSKVIVVSGGNEQAVAFYEKYSFYTKSIILEQKNNVS
jgi:ribosomal protein S18 acetylase RimI-like enzyme